jgi:hypothetical protein
MNIHLPWCRLINLKKENMARNSQYYQRKLENVGPMPDFQSQIAKAYEKPVIRPVVEEAQKLEAQYLPTIFGTLEEMGTGASDMSPAAKLSHIGSRLGQLGSRISANRSIQDMYRTRVQDLANLEAQRWQQNQQRLQNLYNMAFQREQANRAAAQARANRVDTSALEDLLRGGSQNDIAIAVDEGDGTESQTAGMQATPASDQMSLAQLNAKRSASGRPPVSQEYYENTYTPQTVETPSYGQAVWSEAIKNVQESSRQPGLRGQLNTIRDVAALPGAGATAAFDWIL